MKEGILIILLVIVIFKLDSIYLKLDQMIKMKAPEAIKIVPEKYILEREAE